MSVTVSKPLELVARLSEVSAAARLTAGMIERERPTQVRGEGDATRSRVRDPHAPFAHHVSGFGHPALATVPSYSRFREALADLVDECDAPLSRLLADVRMAAISSPFGSPCPSCRTTTWPHRGRRIQREDNVTEFQGTYLCPSCGTDFRAAHDIDTVDWPNGEPTP